MSDLNDFYLKYLDDIWNPGCKCLLFYDKRASARHICHSFQMSTVEELIEDDDWLIYGAVISPYFKEWSRYYLGETVIVTPQEALDAAVLTEKIQASAKLLR